MASGNGFLTESPDPRYGDSTVLVNVNNARGQKFTCPGSGTIEINEIGCWMDGGGSTVVHFGIFTHDAINDCPESLVSNSDSGEIDGSGDDVIKINYSYVTKPQLTGGETYWICLIVGGQGTYLDRFTTGGDSCYLSGLTYPNWPAGAEWEEANASTADSSLYAVYGESGSASESPSPSISESPSESPSSGSSISPSESVSESPSPSVSESPSPSPGWQGYTRGNYAELPTDDTDLEDAYSEQDYTNVGSDNDVRVDQEGTSQYAIHQFKDYVGDEAQCTLLCQLQSSLAPSSSIVILEIYNYEHAGWEWIDSNNSTGANTEFNLTGQIEDLTNYKNGSGIMTCRVYQLMS
jgi:hypothetical protein